MDATIIQAPSSTKNINKERDPEMKSTRKNGQYFFGMKLIKQVLFCKFFNLLSPFKKLCLANIRFRV